MDNENQLTGFGQRSYTGGMDEGGTETIEEEIIDPAERKKNRAKQNQEELRQEARELDREREERRERRMEGGMSATPEEEGGKSQKLEHVLRKEKNLIEYGWSPDDINRAKNALQAMLGVREASADNVIELLISNGKKASSEITLANGETTSVLALLENKEHYATVKEEEAVRYQQQLSPDETEKYAKLKLLRQAGIDNGSARKNDYLKRFVLDDDFHEELQRTFDAENPANLYELAWNISYQDSNEFGVNGQFPVLEMRVEKNKKGEYEGRYIVNKANYIRWVRMWINRSQDKDEDAVTNYFGDVKLSKQYRSIALGEIIDEYTRYFTDEEGEFYGDLSNQTLMEPWMMQTIKSYDVEYKKVMASEKALPEKLQELYHYSKLTKKTLDKSMMYYMSTLAVDFDGASSDNTLGGAWNAMFLAYYNISDFQELQNVLGKDSSFFTRTGMKKAMSEVSKSKAKQTESVSMESFMGSEANKQFEDAFSDGNGNAQETVQDEKAFSKFVNYLSSQWSNHNLVDVVDKALLNSIQETYDFHSKESNRKTNKGEFLEDENSVKLAKLIAKSWIRFSGAGAKNDTAANGFDVASKFINTESYRRKMATEKRGGSFGNPYTVPMFKGVMVDLVTGLKVAEATTTSGINGEKTAERQKTPLEVMVELNEVRLLRSREVRELTRRRDAATGDERDRIQEELDRLNKGQDKLYKQLAGQLEFKSLAMANYAANHVARAQKMYDQVMGAKEVDFDKWTTNSVFHGVTFNRAEFQKEVQDEFLKPLRYLWGTYGELNFNTPVRRSEFVERKPGKDGKEGEDVTEHRTMALGEALFGYEMLNIPEFRKLQKNSRGEEVPGKYIKKGGRYVIDYDKVQKDQTKVWKQWALMKFGADLWTHIDRHSTDPAYGLKHYKNILEALQYIPGEVFGDDTKMTDVRVNAPFFSADQMKWLKKMSGTTNFKLYRRAIFDDLFGPRNDKPSYLGDSISLVLGAVFRGY